MRRLVVLGGGTAGTMVVNKLRRRLDPAQWQITVVDQDDAHLYQPGLLFLPFGGYRPDELVKPRQRFIPDGVRPGARRDRPGRRRPRTTVLLADGRRLGYDYLVIATGYDPAAGPDPGHARRRSGGGASSTSTPSTAPPPCADGAARRSTAAGWSCTSSTCRSSARSRRWSSPSWPRRTSRERGHARPGRDRLRHAAAGRVHQADRRRRSWASMLDERQIAVEPDFLVERIDAEARTLVSYDEREIPFDLLVTVPLNMGADFVARSGLGDELNYVPVDKHTLLSKAHDNIFAIGDANNIPTSKAGSVAHFSVEVFVDNFARARRTAGR